MSGLCLVGIGMLFLLFMAAPSAHAANKSFLGSIGNGTGEEGGNVGAATGLGINRTGAGGVPAGELYILNPRNLRVEEFDSDGTWVRSFGWDVVASGQDNTGTADEQQTVTLGANTIGGSFILRFGGVAAANTSAGIPCNASPTAVQTALEGVAVIGPGNVEVSSPNPGGGNCAIGEIGGPYAVTFKGALGAKDVPELTRALTNLEASGAKSVDISVAVPGGGYEVCEAASEPLDVCKVGGNHSGAGSIAAPPESASGAETLAVDSATGNVFVASNENKRVDVFSARGAFEGAFGWGVDTGANAFEFCTMATGCQAGIANAGAGAFSNLLKAGMAIDPSNGDLYLGERGTLRVDEYSFSLNSSSEVTGAAFVRAFGWDVIPSGQPGDTGTGLETCTAATSCKAGTSGAGDGQMLANTPSDIAIDSAGNIYAVTSPGVDAGSGNCAVATPCRVQKFNPDGTFMEAFGPSSGGAAGCQLSWTTGVANTEAAAGLAIDPSNQHVFVTRKASSTTYELCEFDNSGVLVDQSPEVPRPTNTSGYLHLAILGQQAYVNARTTAQLGGTDVFGPPPSAPGSTTLMPANLTSETATLKGEVVVPSPGGFGYKTTYQFEYLPPGETWVKAPLSPRSVGSVSGSYPVDQHVTGLTPNTRYFVRLQACTLVCTVSGLGEFSTVAAPPTVVSSYAEDVTHGAAVLAAQVNPNSLSTTYHFEWGSQSGRYSSSVPTFERHIGEGRSIVYAEEKIDGLAAATPYYFRVRATNSAGTTVSTEQSFETLNACGLIHGRCLELVSPADKGPAGGATELSGSGVEYSYQAAPLGGRLMYKIGLGGASAGGEVMYEGQRSSTGWEAHQVTPTPTDPNLTKFESTQAAITYGFSPNLSCAVMSSALRLSNDAPQRTIDAGFSNLFLRDADGEYHAITNRVPTNFNSVGAPPRFEYTLIGISQDCNRVTFTTPFHYRGLDGEGETRLYEWNGQTGVLTAISELPAPAGNQVAPVEPGGATPAGVDSWRAVSKDGTSIYISGLRKRTDGPAGSSEFAKVGIFRHFADGSVVDVSHSQNASIGDSGALYQTASEDGNRVFFLANYGLVTAPASHWPSSCTSSSGLGCDLYEYDFNRPVNQRLRDLTADTNGEDVLGASVAGVVGADPSGSYVYFLSRGQLLPDKGDTQAANSSNDTYNLYLQNGPDTTYVATVSGTDRSRLRIESLPGLGWTTRVSNSGRFLLFESEANVTGLEPNGVLQAYLFDATTEMTTCISCRRDGGPPIASVNGVLPTGRKSSNNNSLFDPGTVLTDQGTVFFVKRDALAAGAVSGWRNLYEWRKGQVAFIATSHQTPLQNLALIGSSEDGADLYFTSADPLTWEDHDSQMDIYDARQGGGFTQDPAPPASCDPSAEGSCQVADSPSGPGLGPGSAAHNGPGNVAPKVSPKHRCPKGKRLAKGGTSKRLVKAGKRKRCVKVHKKRHGKHRRSRRADNGRRAWK